jgi:cellobiose phosphorylase
MLAAPPFKNIPVDVMRAVVYNPGIKENAGIFNHTQGWGVMAECLMGNGDRAFEYLKATMPSAYNDRAEIRQSEPYAHAQTTYSAFSPRPGNTRTSWLTGAAAWNFVAITQHILGIHPTFNGLMLSPVIPTTWKGYNAVRFFRGVKYEISVIRQGSGNSVRLEVNGKPIAGNLVPLPAGNKENMKVRVILT